MKALKSLLCMIGLHFWSSWQQTSMRGKFKRKCEHCDKIDTKYESA
jgi:hypothetical protein